MLNKKAHTEILHTKIEKVITDFLQFIKSDDNYTEAQYYDFLDIVRRTHWRLMVQMYSTVLIEYRIKSIKNMKQIIQEDLNVFDEVMEGLTEDILEVLKKNKALKDKERKVEDISDEFFSD